MFDWLKRKLGLTDLDEGMHMTHARLYDVQRRLRQIEDQMGVVMPGLGIAIAKLNPEYSTHEDDKRNASDKIGDQVIARLIGEKKARDAMEGK